MFGPVKVVGAAYRSLLVLAVVASLICTVPGGEVIVLKRTPKDVILSGLLVANDPPMNAPLVCEVAPLRTKLLVILAEDDEEL